MIIKILGGGCANCQKTKVLAQEVVANLGLEAQIQEVKDMADIMAYGVMTTPAVVIDEKVVHSGGVPTRDKMVQILQQN
ncbi:MAG: TM0996/MTH895 family glutaredoxin-like protein [Anaerolineae bacterium]|nr:TM0996/MTH895 family glutaredoxin-like protein [Anaerolineae bacterium]